jgi:hypothetical protein
MMYSKTILSNYSTWDGKMIKIVVIPVKGMFDICLLLLISLTRLLKSIYHQHNT